MFTIKLEELPEIIIAAPPQKKRKEKKEKLK